jgi:surfactin synthase thioesterase subunit/aryl carrier-like protein
VGADDSFFDVGGDSLSLMRLAAEIKRRFGRELPVMELYRAATLRAQGELIDGGALAPLPLLQALSPTRDDSRLTVVAVPYAAGDGLIYHELAAAVDPRIAVYAVNNPRDFDTGRDLDAQMEAFVAALTIEIGEEIDTPIVIWGHCVGYALALTLARRLLAQGADVRAVCVGGVVLDADHAAQSAQIGKLATLPEAQGIVELLTHAGLATAHTLGADDWQTIVEKFRQDSVLSVWCNHEHFCASGAAQLPIPLVCFVAADDPLTEDAEAAARHWLLASTDVRTVTLAEGGHYFVKTRSREVAQHLAALLAARHDPLCNLEVIA